MPRLRETGLTLNILSVYFQATPAEMRAGNTWYRTSLGLIRRIAQDQAGRRNGLHAAFKGRKLTDTALAGAIAALSPNKTWSHNLKLLGQLLRTNKAATYGPQVDKARRCLMGEPPMQVLRGPKERAFFECFVDHKSDAVVVDGHTYSLWMGAFVSTNKAKVTPRLGRLAAEDFRQVAETLGLRPSQVQATCWLAWRRLNESPGHKQDKKAGL